MKKHRFYIFILLLAFMLSACSNPDLSLGKHSSQGKLNEKQEKVFTESNTNYAQRQIEATLYYVYENQALLVPERRIINVKNDEIPELAMIRELLKETKIGKGKIVSPFPQGLQVINAVPIMDDKVLAISFSEEFLLKDQKNMDTTGYIEKEKLKRELMLNSIAATITDNYSYIGIQIFIKPKDDKANIKRLDNNFMFKGNNDNMPPIVREEKYISKPKYITEIFIEAWQKQDFETMLNFVYASPRITESELVELAKNSRKIVGFDVSEGSIFNEGKSSVLSLKLVVDGNHEDIVYPLNLVNDEGVWKVEAINLAKLCGCLN